MESQHIEEGVMAIGLIFEVPNTTQSQYDQVREAVMPNGQPPAGMLYHVAGPGQGTWIVVEVWESEAAARRFADEQLGQQLQQAGIPNAQPKFFQVYKTMEGMTVEAAEEVAEELVKRENLE
jgi:hypothetical protein